MCPCCASRVCLPGTVRYRWGSRRRLLLLLRRGGQGILLEHYGVVLPARPGDGLKAWRQAGSVNHERVVPAACQSEEGSGSGALRCVLCLSI